MIVKNGLPTENVVYASRNKQSFHGPTLNIDVFHVDLGFLFASMRFSIVGKRHSIINSVHFPPKKKAHKKAIIVDDIFATLLL